LVFTGGDGRTTLRLAVRPSGTEPKLKGYIEIRQPATDDLAGARAAAAELTAKVQAEAGGYLQRGPN
jgi:phosphomannomutase